MGKVVVTILLCFLLNSCTPPLENGAYMDTSDAQADRVTARVGEPVKVTVEGGFIVAEKYYQEELAHPGVSLGACFWYAPDRTTRGGLCGGKNDKRPLPGTLKMVDGTDFIKDFGDIVVKRGEYRKIEHTFTFTSSKLGEVAIMPAYEFYNDAYEGSSGYEPGPENTVRVTFE